MTDVIRCVNLELNGADRDALRRAREASEWAEQRLASELERIVANHPTGDRLVAIDRLDIAIDVADWSGWDGALLDGLRRELSALLVVEVERTAARNEAPARSDVAGPRNGWQPRGPLDALRFYLGCGRLPWYRTKDTFAAELLAWLQAASAEALRAELAPLLATPAAARRFIRELPEETLAALLERSQFLPVARARVWAADVALLREFLREAASAAGRMPSFEAVPSLAVAPGYSLPEALWVALLEHYAREPALREACGRALVVFVAACFAEAQALGWIGGPLERAAESAASANAPEGSRRPSFASPELSEAFLRAGAQFAEAPEIPGGAARYPVTSSSEAAVEGYFVANAGTVLLAPYLRRYLERLGHVRGDRIVDPGAALVAVDFLASGRTDAPREYEVVLTKLLCGFGLEEAPPRLAAADARTRQEADALLASIIEHWAVLRNTSVTGLREGFLQREGKLSLSPRNNWLLQVEQKAYDLLLGQLPWSYRMIQLPWMERMLVVEWVD